MQKYARCQDVGGKGGRIPEGEVRRIYVLFAYEKEGQEIMSLVDKPKIMVKTQYVVTKTMKEDLQMATAPN